MLFNGFLNAYTAPFEILF